MYSSHSYFLYASPGIIKTSATGNSKRSMHAGADAPGNPYNVYLGWAVTAEEKKTDLMDKNFRGFTVNIIAAAADNITRV